MSFRQLVPWWGRIAAKLVLARLPARYGFWHRLNLFSHGAMDDPDYAQRVFGSHFDRSPFGRKAGGFVGLELGPGDSVMSALVAAAYGSAGWHLVDAGDYATPDLGPYRQMAQRLRAHGLPAPDLTGAVDLRDVLAACRATYSTRGLQSLRALPTASIDFIWSQAVLEHVRRAEFLDTMHELHRVLRPDGVASHRVDLKDHLGGSLNNLRLPEELWERNWMGARSGFYTNRIRFKEMCSLFEQAGFAVEVLSVNRWEVLPVKRSALTIPFRDMSEEELRVREFDVLLTRLPGDWASKYHRG
jgi:SAM-dependent methyltransferase